MHHIPMPPATLNGYPVIAERMIDPETYAIVCFRREHSHHQYVVAKWSVHSPNEWQHGDYFADFFSAAHCFQSSAKGF